MGQRGTQFKQETFRDQAKTTKQFDILAVGISFELSAFFPSSRHIKKMLLLKLMQVNSKKPET